MVSTSKGHSPKVFIPRYLEITLLLGIQMEVVLAGFIYKAQSTMPRYLAITLLEMAIGMRGYLVQGLLVLIIKSVIIYLKGLHSISKPLENIMHLAYSSLTSKTPYFVRISIILVVIMLFNSMEIMLEQS